jgi:phosphonopyruvate decarboxylase
MAKRESRVDTVGVSDKLLVPWLKGKKYVNVSDEGEAVGWAGGYYLATGKPATVFVSADGFMNALNPLTSWVIPEGIKMKFIISIGRKEPQHYVATETVPQIIKLLPKAEGISYKFV